MLNTIASRCQWYYLLDAASSNEAQTLVEGPYASTPPARVFAGLCAARLGEESYSIQRVTREREPLEAAT